jgi:hypothetical protein
MQLVKAPLKTIYDGKPEQLRTHIQEFTRCMQNTGLYQEFQIMTTENPRPEEIPEEEWTNDYPLWWQTINFLEKFGAVSLELYIQERERIDDVLAMLNEPPQVSTDDGAKELASKQHSMWITELLDNSCSSNVSADMSAFKKETKGDGILLFYVFLWENVGYTKEAIIAAEQQHTKEKLSLSTTSIMTLANSPSTLAHTSGKSWLPVHRLPISITFWYFHRSKRPMMKSSSPSSCNFMKVGELVKEMVPISPSCNFSPEQIQSLNILQFLVSGKLRQSPVNCKVYRPNLTFCRPNLQPYLPIRTSCRRCRPTRIAPLDNHTRKKMKLVSLMVPHGTITPGTSVWSMRWPGRKPMVTNGS